MCPWPSICFLGPSGTFLDLLPPASPPPFQKRDAQHMFLQHNKISIENEIFELATHRGPIFCGGNRDIEIKIFARDQKKIDRDHENFDRWALWDVCCPVLRFSAPVRETQIPWTRKYSKITKKYPKCPKDPAILKILWSQ